MRRLSFVLFFIAIATAFAMSQDIIVKKDGSVINAYNLGEGKDVYYYTLQPSDDAPIQVIKKSDVFTAKISEQQRTQAQRKPITATFTREIEPTKIKNGVQQGRKFVARTPDGHELNYQVLSEDNHTLQVIKGTYHENKYVVPEYVIVGDIQYTVTELGVNAFRREGSIEVIRLPYTLIKIGESAFSNTAFNNIVFPESLKFIDSSAFRDASLDKIILPEGLEELGKCAFYNCHEDEPFLELYIPSSIKKIGEDCFRFIGNKKSFRGYYQGHILNMPDFITVKNCNSYGIDEEAVRDYLNTKY